MAKRIISMLTVLVLSVICMTSVASAEAPDLDYEISPCWLYTDLCTSTLVFSGKTATCKSTLTGYKGETTTIGINQFLEKKDSSGEWKIIEVWKKSVTGYQGSATNYAYDLSAGTYRLKSMFAVFSGSNYEIVTKYSSEKVLK